MALNSSGPIAIGGCTSGVSIAKELGLTTTAQHSLNCTSYRTLSGQASGAVSMNAFHGKSNNTVSANYVMVGWGGYGGAYCSCYGGGGGGGGGAVKTGTFTLKTCKTYLLTKTNSGCGATTFSGCCITTIRAGNGGAGARTIYHCVCGCSIPYCRLPPGAGVCGGAGGGGGGGPHWSGSRSGGSPRGGTGVSGGAGGGGGASGCGGAGTTYLGGAGGAGTAVSILCTTVYFGGGGGGGTCGTSCGSLAAPGAGGGGYGGFERSCTPGQGAALFSGGGGGGQAFGSNYPYTTSGSAIGIVYYSGTTPKFNGGIIKIQGCKTYHMLRTAAACINLSPIVSCYVLTRLLLVGGGAAGGGNRSNFSYGGGGGAGSMICGYMYLTKGITYSVVVGAGGVCSRCCGGRGNCTYINPYQSGYLLAAGGGGGGKRNKYGATGGSGGGAGNSCGTLPNLYGGQVWTYLDGNIGGNGQFSSAGSGGGGGGAGAAGQNASGGYGGSGGIGKLNNISGSNVYYAGGGGGTGNSSNGSGGCGGGGSGGTCGTAGTANTGGGGGGGKNGLGASGGSGIVYIASLSTPLTITGTYTGPTCVGGYKTYKFTGSGTFKY